MELKLRAKEAVEILLKSALQAQSLGCFDLSGYKSGFESILRNLLSYLNDMISQPVLR